MSTEHPSKLLIIGDFNYPNVNWSSWAAQSSNTLSSESNFISCLRNNFLIQHVILPTRCRGSQTPHVLDLCITNCDFVEDVLYLSPLGKSDHCVLRCVCNLCVADVCPGKVKLNYSKGDYEELRKFVSDKIQMNNVTNNCHNSVETEWGFLKSCLVDIPRNVIPVVSDSSWRRKKNWQHPLPKEIVTIINRKHRLWTRYMETRDTKVFTEFKRVRNTVTRMLRLKVRQSQLDIAKSCKDNPKKFWQHVRSKSVASKSSLGTITTVDCNGLKLEVTSDLEKANLFSDYFAKVFTIEPDHISATLSARTAVSSMPKVVITDSEICSKLANLNVHKSPGPDQVHPRVLFELRNVIVPKLSTLFERSLSEGTVPYDWKNSIVTVIHKKGRKDLVETTDLYH